MDIQFSSVQSLTHVRLFVTPWTAACQASLSITNSRWLLELKSIKSVMLSSHLSICHPLLLPSIFPRSGSFPMREFFTSGGQSIGVPASASVLPMNTQDWSPLGWTGWISLLSKGLSRVFSNTTVQKHQFFNTGFWQMLFLYLSYDHMIFFPFLICWYDSESHSVVSNSLWPHVLYSPWNSPGQNTGVGNLSLLQWIFPSQGSNPGLPNCRGILYQLSHKGSPLIFDYWTVTAYLG